LREHSATHGNKDTVIHFSSRKGQIFVMGRLKVPLWGFKRNHTDDEIFASMGILDDSSRPKQGCPVLLHQQDEIAWF